MSVRRGLWRTWIVLTTIWVVLLLLTGKYWCPLFFWRDSPQCLANSYYEQSAGLFGLPLATLIVGLIVGWIISGFRARKS
jgi:hypothetical protein